MAIGLGASLDEAMRNATSSMFDWLVARYRLTFLEVAQVLGTSAEFRISVVGFSHAGIALKIQKDRLRALKTPASTGGQ